MTSLFWLDNKVILTTWWHNYGVIDKSKYLSKISIINKRLFFKLCIKNINKIFIKYW